MLSTLCLYLILVAVSLWSVLEVTRKVDSPQNSVWILGFTIFAVYGIANALYQFGTVGLLVLPFLFPIKAALDVTAFTSFIIGAYSMIKHGNISKYLYGLPIGFGIVITVLAALIPSAIVQFILAAPFLGYLYFHERSEFDVWAPAFCTLGAATVLRMFSFNLVIVNTEDVSVVVYIAALVQLVAKSLHTSIRESFHLSGLPMYERLP